MIKSPDILLGSIRAIIAEELPEPYAADADLVFGNLCEGQEDSFKLVINLSWNKNISDLDKAKEEMKSGEWTHRMTRRIHEQFGRDNLLISLRMPKVVREPKAIFGGI